MEALVTHSVKNVYVTITAEKINWKLDLWYWRCSKKPELLHELEKGKKKVPKDKKQKKAKLLVRGSSFKSVETFNCRDSDFLVRKYGLVTLRRKDSKVGMLLSDSMDPSKLISLEQWQKEKSKKLKVLYPAIIKDHNSHINGVDVHKQLKTTYKTDQKSRFWWYLKVFFDLMNSVAVYAHINYKTEENARMSLIHS